MSACRNVANHTSSPDGYINRDEWAVEMGKTHRQTRCPDCGLFVIWIRRKPGGRSVEDILERHQDCGCLTCLQRMTGADVQRTDGTGAQ